ncbi:uncharacterized protein ACBT44_005642 isoform 1-T2 [Syngnathus typhle]
MSESGRKHESVQGADSQPQVTDGTMVSNPTTSEEPRLGQRVRNRTEKGQELHDEQLRRVAHRFSVCYDKWKDATKVAKQALRGDNRRYSEEHLTEYITQVCNGSKRLNDVYYEWRRIDVPDNETRRRADTCEVVTGTIVKEARNLLDKGAKGQTTSHHTKSSSASRKSAAAEVAANEAALEVMLEQRLIEELQKLEAAELKAKQEAENAERQRLVDAKRRELERLKTIKKLNAAKARQQVYDQSEGSGHVSKGNCSDEEIKELLHRRVSVKREINSRTSSPQNCSPTRQKDRVEDSTSALVRALAESISASRIPLPEPTVFNGDPLRFNDWKVSFQTLVARKNIPAEEKMYYLRKYVGGAAKRSIESYFWLGSESAYYAAWQMLEERYGNPFLIAKAFRDKIDSWPKINSKGSVELQELADFLRSCKSYFF